MWLFVRHNNRTSETKTPGNFRTLFHIFHKSQTKAKDRNIERGKCCLVLGDNDDGHDYEHNCDEDGHHDDGEQDDGDHDDGEQARGGESGSHQCVEEGREANQLWQQYS